MNSNSYLIASGKGGVGKTSLTSALGILLAQSGYKVALVDMDFGQRSLDIMMNLENNVVFDITDVAMGMCKLKQAVVECPDHPGLSIINASQVRDAGNVDRKKCSVVIDELCRENDYVLIDCPPGVGPGLRLVSVLSRRAVIIVTPDAVSVRDAQRAMYAMRDLGVCEFHLVVNRAKPRHFNIDYDASPEMISEWLGQKPIAVIHENDRANPLIGDKNVEKVVRTITGDKRISWPAEKPSPLEWLKAIITRKNKRSTDAEAV